MADSAQLWQGYASLKQLVKVGDDSMLTLNTHILPSVHVLDQEGAGSPYAWFSDLVNQELMVCVHDLLLSKATVTAESAEKSKSDPSRQFEFRKSSSFRGMFVFKPSSARHHVLLLNQAVPSTPVSVCAAFVNEYGRKVLPYVTSPSTGQGYSSFKMLPESVHAYIDCCEPFSSLGIFKVLKKLDPNHKVSLDIASYFRPRKSEQLVGREEDFLEVPTAALKQRKSKRKPLAVKRLKLSRPKGPKAVTVPASQPLIEPALRGMGAAPSPAEAVLDTAVPVDMIDQLFDFGSQPVDNKRDVPVDSREDTPPLDVQLPPRKVVVRGKGEGRRAVPQGKSPTHRQAIQLQTSSEVIRDSMGKIRKLPLKPSAAFPKPHPLRDATPTCKVDKCAVEGTTCDEQDWVFSPCDEPCTFLTPPTPLLLDDQSNSPRLPSNTGQDVEGDGSGGSVGDDGGGSDGGDGGGSVGDGSGGSVGDDGGGSDGGDGGGSDGVCRDGGVGGVRSPVLDDITNTASKSPTSLSSSADSAKSDQPSENFDEGCVYISSEEEVTCLGSEPGRGKKKMVKSTHLTLDQILHGVTRVGDLTRNKIIQWLRLRRPVILDVFKGRIPSQRHKDYSTSGKKRAALVHCVDTSMFTTEGLDCLHTNLLKMFCSSNMKYFDYVMSVLVPECVVRIIADIHHLSFEEAESKMYMYTYDSVDLSQDSDDDS